MIQALRIAIPLVSFLLLGVAGLGLTRAHFSPSRVKRRTLLAGVALPWILVPLLGWATARLFALPTEEAWGVLLLCACPAGSITAVYSLLARANVALAFSLAMSSSLLSIALTPALLWLLSRGSPTPFPLLPTVIQISLFLLLPLVAGMALRARFPEAVLRWESKLRLLSLAGVVLLVALGIACSPADFLTGLGRLALPVLAFSAAALFVGAALGRLFRLGAADAFPFALQFGVRNLAIATLMAVSVLGDQRAAAFSAAFFVLQTPILLAAAELARRRAAEPGGRDS